MVKNRVLEMETVKIEQHNFSDIKQRGKKWSAKIYQQKHSCG